MTTLSATEARKNFYRLIDETSLTHEPIVITGCHADRAISSASLMQYIKCRGDFASPIR